MTTSTGRITQPLREEHAELLPYIEELRTTADAVGVESLPTVRAGVEEVYDFLTHHLIPHAEAEDAVLYPAVAKLIGAGEPIAGLEGLAATPTTGTMSREHVVVGGLVQELAALRAGLEGATLGPPTAAALRRILYGLYTLVKTHFDNEEAIYLPLIDAKLSPEQGHELFESMEEAAHQIKARLGLRPTTDEHGHAHA